MLISQDMIPALILLAGQHTHSMLEDPHLHLGRSTLRYDRPSAS